MRTNKLFSGVESDTGYNVDLGMRQLSMESEFIANVIETFREVIPSLAFKIKSLTSTVVRDNDRHVAFSYVPKNKELKEKIKHINYSLYRKTLVHTPEGFKGSFIDYVVCLNRVLPSLFASSNELLGEYNFVLSAFITNKENKTSLKDHTTLFRQAAQLRESVLAETGKFFVENDTSKKYLGDVLERFADLDSLVSETRKLEKFHDDQNMRSIKMSIDKSVDLLDVIIKNLNSNEIGNVSGAAAKNISEGAYEIAKLVETLSIMKFRTEQIIVSVDELFKTIEKIA